MALGMHRIAAGQQHLLVIVKYLPENRMISEKRGIRVLQPIAHRLRILYVVLLVLLGQMIPGMAQAGTYDGAMRSTDYRVFSGDVNGDGREDILVKAHSRLVMLPFDDDLIIPLNIKPRSPSFMLLSSANGSYELVADPDTAQLAFAGWTAANYSLVFGDAQGADAGSVSIKGSAIGQGDFVVAMSAASGQLTLVGAPVIAPGTPSTDPAAETPPLTASPIITPHLDNADAGTLPGALAVSNSGTAIYSIGLAAPPGTNGMQPALSLSYSSDGSNSMLGLGWSLSGLSSIHRCAKTIANDGVAGRISFDTADRLCIDGQRLLRADGANPGTNPAGQDAAYWVAGALFQTEIEGFARITRLSNGFKVEDKDGLVRYFGTDANSAIAAQGRTDGQPLLWALSRVEDRSGNYMVVSYATDSVTGEYTPQQIRYGGNTAAGTAADLAVRFTYISRSDAQIQYMGGSRNDLRSLLSHVKTYISTADDGSGGTLARDYEISYINSAGSGRSLVNWIQVAARNPLSGSMESLPRTDFAWGDGGMPKLVQKQQFDLYVMGDGDSVPAGPVLTGAVHGGGITSVMVPFLACPPGICYTRFFNGYITGQSGNGGYWRTQLDMSQLSGKYKKMHVGDLDGDGIDDIVMTGPERWAYCLAKEPSGNDPVFAQCQFGGSLPQNARQAAQLLASLENNGKSQLLYFDQANQASICSYNGAVNCRTVPTIVPEGVEMADLVPISLSKYGQSDFYMVRDPLVDPHAEQLDVTLCRMSSTGLTCRVIDSGDRFSAGLGAGDVNGDGLTDFFYSVTGGSKLCLSTETDVSCKPMAVRGAVASPLNSAGFGYFYAGVADMLGDGVNRYWGYSALASRPDVLCRVVDGVEICQPVDVSGLPAATQALAAGLSTSRPFSIDGSGIPASLNCEQDALPQNGSFVQHCWVTSLLMPPEQDRLITVTNGVGHVAQLDYARGDDVAMYSRSAIVAGTLRRPTYPQREIAPGVLVKQSRQSNGQGGWVVSKHRYAGAMSDATGRGSLGFTTVSVVDAATDITSESAYAQLFPVVGMETGRRRFTGTCDLENASYNLTQKTMTAASGAVNYFPYVSDATTVRHDLDCSDLGKTEVVNGYTDGWGNLNAQTTTVTGGGRSFTQVTNTSFFTASGANYLAGLPVLVSTRRTDETAVSRETSYTYNSITGLRETETVEPNKPSLKVETSFSRDKNLFGLVNKVTQSWTDPACAANGWPEGGCVAAKSRTMSDTTYDNKGRFPQTVKNALGHSNSQSFDLATGLMLTLKDANNLQTTWSIDGHGRVHVEKRADGTETRSYLKQCASACPLSATTAQITELYSGNARIMVPQVVYRDSAGHVERSASWGFDGRVIVADQTYDGRGRLLKTYQPRYENDADVLASSLEYDELNRITKTVTLDDAGSERALTTQYSGFTVEQTNPLQQRRTEKRDVMGQLRSVLDSNAPRGTTSFTYDPFGSLLTTTDPGGNVISVEYDTLGRKTALRDPDLGWISYDIDPLGQTYAQTSPVQRSSGRKSWMSYDALGRMTARYEPSLTHDLESHWVYDSAVMGVGQLAEAFTSKPAAKDYRRLHTYDSLGRPLKTTQYLSDGAYSSATSYDAWGRLASQTYQRGSGAAKIYSSRYNSYGYLSRIERGSLVLWQALQQDASNRVLKALLGNGLTKTFKYNESSGRVQNADVTTASNIARLQEGYAYDALGNVTHRTQYWDAGGFQETFVYDDLNRLKSSQVQGNAEQGFTYDATGNILSKSGIGTYNYAVGPNTPLPHAVKSVSGIPGTFVYDANGNLLSGAGRTVTWTSFDMPLTITKGASSARFYYGPEHQRLRQLRGDGSVVYAGAQEVEYVAGGVRVKTYWPQGIGMEIEEAGATKLHWMHGDRLGSLIAFTGEDGAIRVDGKLEYDAWGKRRSAVDNASVDDGIDGRIDNRGFTGHEMLDQLDLVHMNGRVYDPLLAKFMSADPLVSEPMNGQSYNRYSYVFNNPTNLTDPTGFQVEGYVTGSNIFRTGVAYVRAMMLEGFITRDQANAMLPEDTNNATLANAGVRSIRENKGSANSGGGVSQWFSEAWSNTKERIGSVFSGKGLPATEAERAAWVAGLREAQAQGKENEYVNRNPLPGFNLATNILMMGAGTERAAVNTVLKSGTAQLEQALGKLSGDQLKGIYGKEGVEQFRVLFGSGVKGAEARLANMPTSTEITAFSAGAYKELARRILVDYQKTGNQVGIQLQSMRIQILDQMAPLMK